MVGAIRQSLVWRERLHAQPQLLARCERRLLARFLRETVSRSSFYRDRGYRRALGRGDPQSAFEHLPLLEKGALRRHAEAFGAREDPDAFFRVQSTGSTGVPIEMWFDRDYFVSYYSGLLDFLRRMRLWPEPLSLGLLSVAVSPKAVYGEGDYWFVQPALNYSLFQRLNVRDGSPGEVVAYVAAKAPLVIRGMPSVLEVLAGHQRAHPAIGPIRPRLVLSTAETLLPSKRREIEETFGAPVLEEYGLTEVGGVVARECEARAGFHVIAPDYRVEIVDERGRALPAGEEGQIVITNLYHRPVPVLRYRTGDHGILSREPCACGSTLPRIVKFTGRELSRFTRAGGGDYNPFEMFREYLFGLPARQFQLIQETDGNLTLVYAAGRRLDDEEAIRRLRVRARELHGPECEVRLERVERIEHERKFHPFLRRSGAGGDPGAPAERPYHAL